MEKYKYFILVLMIIAGAYFVVIGYFERKIKFRAFEACLSSVEDPASNWVTRKDTVDYCKKENF